MKSRLFPELKPANDHERFMLEAIKQAEKAIDLAECPIGCVIVKDGKVFVRAHNLRLTKGNSLAHAEIVAINKACKKLGDWRLEDCDMYVTLEPCSMCAGAIVLSRIERLFIGTMDPKAGACGSLRNIPGDERLNHQPELIYGVLQTECQAILKDFFRKLRQVRKEERRSVQ